MSTSYPRIFVAYTGTCAHAPLIGAQDHVSNRVLNVLWTGSTLGMAQQFQDGEIRKLRVTLNNPLVLDEEQRRAQFGLQSHARIVDHAQKQVTQGQASWDGVVFVDAADGMEVADVIAVFSDPTSHTLSVAHAVQVIGTLTFDETLDDWVASAGFHWTQDFAPAQPPWQDATMAANGLEVCDNFDHWFKDSQILNDVGTPRMVFHGTRDAFDTFEPGRYQSGYFFTPSPAYALVRAIDDSEMPLENQENLIPVFLSMRQPLDIRLGLSPEDESLLLDAGASADQFDFIRDKDSDQYMVLLHDFGGDRFVDICQRAGFDGMIFNEIADTPDNFAYAVFSPTQIKSAIANCGLYLEHSASLTDLDAQMQIDKGHKAKNSMAHTNARAVALKGSTR